MRRICRWWWMVLVFFSPLVSVSQVPFKKGVNLTTWFQAESAREIQFSKFTKKDFERIKSLGCNVIRLPINLHAMTNGEPDYILDPIFLSFLDQAVDWAEALELHLILDNHTFDPASATSPIIGPVLVKVWTQMASHYKDRSDFIYYEVLNEPHDISDALWGSIQQTVIDAIRTQDTKHTIIVGGSGYNSYSNLNSIPHYTDTKLIYTFHFYDPFIFTHQGASWTTPSMVPLAGVPFPYRATSMPSVPAALKGTWIESLMNNYPTDGTVAKVKQLIDVAVNFKNQRGVPVYCGELGVFIPNSDDAQRVAWHAVVTGYLNEKGIPWTTWDYQGGFGLFKKNSNELFDYDLNVPLLQALEFTVPEQKPNIQLPLSKGRIIYDDFIGEGIVEANSTSDGILDYYSAVTPHAGDYCLQWTGVPQYATIGFDFKPNIDLSQAAEHDFTLDFWVRGNSPGATFDVRFIDTKTGTGDHPWRMGKTIDNTFAAWDGAWHQVSIPLKNMEEKGSWDNAWFSAEGKFKWSQIDRLEIVAEEQALTGITFSFDDIKLAGEEFVIVTGIENINNQFELSLYPNPAKQNFTIAFSLPHRDDVSIKLHSTMGHVVKSIFTGRLEAGRQQLSSNVSDIPDGLYLVTLESAGGSQSRKVVISASRE